MKGKKKKHDWNLKEDNEKKVLDWLASDLEEEYEEAINEYKKTGDEYYAGMQEAYYRVLDMLDSRATTIKEIYEED